jgi:hypothetical protein
MDTVKNYTLCTEDTVIKSLAADATQAKFRKSKGDEWVSKVLGGIREGSQTPEVQEYQKENQYQLYLHCKDAYSESIWKQGDTKFSGLWSYESRY